MILKAIGLCFAVGLTSACAKSILDTNDTRCPFKERGGCQSVEMVNRMVQEGRFTPDGQFVQDSSNAGGNEKPSCKGFKKCLKK